MAQWTGVALVADFPAGSCRRLEVDGVVTGEALSPPAYEPIATFPIQVENGIVQVRDNRFD